MEMTKAEIIRIYREAKEPNKQIYILAQLNAVSVNEIKTILAEAGIEDKEFQEAKTDDYKNWHQWTPEECEQLLRLRNEGKTFGQIAIIMKKGNKTLSWKYNKLLKKGCKIMGTSKNVEPEQRKKLIINEEFEKAFDEADAAIEKIKADPKQPDELNEIPVVETEPSPQSEPSAFDIFGIIDRLHGIFGSEINYMQFDRMTDFLAIKFGETLVQIYTISAN